ncbi:hypothetical protein QTH91_05905 [Variovorax dokdonensis]|uniref:Uncharacterized protein n=1 Tax=Variovorax dokdonensis TaxID=344883 RepID=A0ABT7N7T6_9BURK|nr:hypothetical protein [Variovorax dokdonensis]MDM0044008.1 hypothetical protein [Variovorax dokdonensis]
MTGLTKQEAIELGYPHYNSDDPCPKCGGDKFYVNDKGCVTCEKKRTELYRQSLQERDRKYTPMERVELIAEAGGIDELEIELITQGNKKLALAWLVFKATKLRYKCIGVFDMSQDPRALKPWMKGLEEAWGFADDEETEDDDA